MGPEAVVDGDECVDLQGIGMEAAAFLAKSSRSNLENVPATGLKIWINDRGGRTSGEWGVDWELLESRRLGGARGDRRRQGLLLAGVAVATVPFLSLDAAAQTALPDINVIAPAPVSSPRGSGSKSASTAPSRPARGRSTRSQARPTQPTTPQPAATAAATESGGIDRDKVPSNTQVLTSANFDHDRSPSFFDSLLQSLPGVSVSDQTGNPFQRDLNYRGFVASPVLGTPQGIAVYQNGVRINEVFGDTVNWDFIPDIAVHRLSLVPNNPVYGLNAIGGAISIEMKSGFTYQGKEFEVMGGSFGRIQGTAQAGFQDGGFAGYAMTDAIHDKGWRQFASSSDLNRLFVDLGTRGDQGEFHLSFSGANNKLSGTVGTPLEMLQRQWNSVFTWPQSTQNQLAFVTANASYTPTDTLTLAGNTYFRGFWQHHLDGNDTEAQFCDPGFGPLLCFGDGTTPLNGVGNLVIPPTATLGELDRTQTNTASFGGSAQATSTTKIFDRPNNFVIGASIDHGHLQFNALSTTTYTGLYATDTFELTPRLAITAGGRFNLAQIKLEDQLGGPLSSDNQYQRFNPVVGVTFKVLDNVTVYGGYSEANRAPTPLELGCSDPSRPCLIDNFLVSDPPLKQVVSHTVEAGLRGNVDLAGGGALRWNAGVFNALNTDDIINVASTTVLGQGYFLNAGKTCGKASRPASRSSSIPGTCMPTTRSWTRRTRARSSCRRRQRKHLRLAGRPHPGGAAASLQGGCRICGDRRLEARLRRQCGRQPVHGGRPSEPESQGAALCGGEPYRVNKNWELFMLVQNLFNQHYYTTGTFFSPASIAPTVVLTDPRMFVPGMPLAG
jgi:iron complex outermembrane receptor protein